jgi:hypothetical protein
MIELTFDATALGNEKFEPTHVGCYEIDLNVRSCRRAFRSTSSRRRPWQAATVPVAPGNRTAESGPAAADRSSPPPATPRAPPPACRQAGRPAPQRLRRRVVPQRAVRSLAEDFQRPGMAAVEALEVPCARDDFREVPTLTRPGGHPTHEPERGRLARRAARMAALQFRGTDRGFWWAVESLPSDGQGNTRTAATPSAGSAPNRHLPRRTELVPDTRRTAAQSGRSRLTGCKHGLVP